LKDVETLINVGLNELSISINDIEEVLITKWNNLFTITALLKSNLKIILKLWK